MSDRIGIKTRTRFGYERGSSILVSEELKRSQCAGFDGSRMGFDLGDYVPQPIKDAANSVVDATGQVLPGPVKDLTTSLNDKFQSLAKTDEGQAVMRAFATTLQQAMISPELAISLGPVGLILSAGILTLPGLATGENINQAAVQELTWRVGTAAQMITGDPSLAGQFGASLPEQWKNIASQFQGQFQTVSDKLTETAKAQFPNLPLKDALAQLNITPDQLAAQLGVRTDIAAMVLDYAKGAMVFDLNAYDPKTGLSKKAMVANISKIAPTVKLSAIDYEKAGEGEQSNPQIALLARPMKMTNVGNGVVVPLPASAAFTTGFLTGVGIIVKGGPNPPDLAVVRASLSAGDARTGYDAGSAYMRGHLYPKFQGTQRAGMSPAGAGQKVADGMSGAGLSGPQAAAVVEAISGAHPDVPGGVNAGLDDHAAATPPHESWWQKFLDFFGL